MKCFARTLSVVMILTLAWMNAGCNTVKGVGQDISGAAQGVQDAANKNDSSKPKEPAK
jgi:predicted small secreted protein